MTNREMIAMLQRLPLDEEVSCYCSDTDEAFKVWGAEADPDLGGVLIEIEKEEEE